MTNDIVIEKYFTEVHYKICTIFITLLYVLGPEFND